MMMMIITKKIHSSSVWRRGGRPARSRCRRGARRPTSEAGSGVAIPYPSRAVNSFQTTLTPNPKQFYKYYSVPKQEETCF